MWVLRGWDIERFYCILLLGYTPYERIFIRNVLLTHLSKLVMIKTRQHVIESTESFHEYRCLFG